MTLQWIRTLLRVTKFERTFFGKGLNLLAPLDIQWPKCFQLQRALPPDPLTKGSAPGPRWGLCPQTPVIVSCSALAMVLPPTTDPFRRL